MDIFKQDLELRAYLNSQIRVGTQMSEYCVQHSCVTNVYSCGQGWAMWVSEESGLSLEGGNQGGKWMALL